MWHSRNTYFEGHGRESAKRSRTKAGHRNKWCISIVLLANQKGLPLRWAVVPGSVKDHHAVGAMIADIRGLEWVKGVPLVCDRAMGMQSSVKNLHDTGLHFLTAAHVDSIESYSAKLPWEVFWRYRSRRQKRVANRISSVSCGARGK